MGYHGVQPASPLPLLLINTNGALELQSTALAILERAPSPICTLSIAGPPLEGKSALANVLMRALGGTPTLDDAGHFRMSHATDTKGMRAPRGAGVWLWISSQRPPQGCGSVALLDSGASSGELSSNFDATLSRYDAVEEAHVRMLSFLLLTSSRLILNVRRQPSETLLSQLVLATKTASTLLAPPRKTSPLLRHSQRGSLPLPLGSSSATTPLDSSMSPPPSMLLPSPANLAADRSWSGHSPNQLILAGSPELVLVLRDAQLQMRAEGEDLQDFEVPVERWMSLAPERDGSLLLQFFSSQALLQLSPPSDMELELLARLHPISTEGEFGASLARLAANLTDDLRGLQLHANSADGSAMATWYQVVTDLLNRG